ncbi:uncharacterized protein LOC130130976 [Lampris incognitus]|uniref:uncharacterized protein LOC130130976 n=1 Tax=Lampris incognitus TaxID=2546036 RepID=UPI0024B50258|nr:uncharacterized protein LOC130130976 [Lampris incognitus]
MAGFYYAIIKFILPYSILSGWFPASLSEVQTVKVQPGDQVTLTCTNISNNANYTEWFRQVEGSKPQCIASMYEARSRAQLCDGFQKYKYQITADMSYAFLIIKSVDLSDSGLYYCGFYTSAYTAIGNAIFLRVQDESVGPSFLIFGLLSSVIVILILIIVGVILKISRQSHLLTEVNHQLQPQRSENLASCDPNYAALSFHPKKKRSRMPMSEREVQTNVVYATTR